MKPFALLIFFITTLALAQNPRTQEVGDFNEVKVYDRMTVKLVKSDENKVVLSGQDIDDIVIVNKDGILKIRMEIENSFDGDKTFVEVHYKDLDIIDGNEGSLIIANELIEQDEIEIRTQEGARVNAGLNVKEVNLRAVTGGMIQANGNATTQNIELNTGGIFMGKDFETETTNIRIQAGGEADINASKLADIKIRAGGDVYVYGHPQEIRQNKFIGGKVKEMR